MSSYDRRLLHQQIFGQERRDNIGSTNLEGELPFVTRASVREAMNRRIEPVVWHTTGWSPAPEDYITYNPSLSGRIDSDNEEVRYLREFMEYNIQNQRRQEPYTINDYMADLPSSFSRESYEKFEEKMRLGKFNLEPKPSKKTLSNPRLSLKEGTDDL